MSALEPEAKEPTVEREIRQIMPAAEYYAVFFDEETGEPWVDALAGWALVVESSGEPSDESQRTRVIGLAVDGVDVIFVDDFPNFVGYLSPESKLDDWKGDALAAWEVYVERKQSTEPPRAPHLKKLWS